LVFFICKPAIVFNSILRGGDNVEFLNMLWAFLAGFLSIVLICLVGKLIFIKWGRKQEGAWNLKEKLIPYALGFGNTAFMGIPVIMLIMPSSEVAEALVYVLAYTLGFNILTWTLGTYLMSGDKKYLTVKKAILNPPTLAIIVAIPLFFVTIEDPDSNRILEVLGYAANMVAPLSMTALGIRFAEMKFKELFNDKWVYLTAAIKLVIIPLAFWGILRLIGFSNTIMSTTLYILVLMPAAVNVLLFAENFGMDTKLAAKIVLFTTLFSAVTIPLMLMLPL
jgi:hypothetical protein